MLLMIMAIPDIPPETRSKGTRNIAVPTDMRKVPRMTNATFLTAANNAGMDIFFI